MAAQGALHVLQAVDTAFDDDRGEGSSFIPSTSWKGYKPGYAFKTGDSGLGYYREAEADQKIDGRAKADEGTAGPSKRDASELLEVFSLLSLSCVALDALGHGHLPREHTHVCTWRFHNLLLLDFPSLITLQDALEIPSVCFSCRKLSNWPRI